jgi:hypothetical protein
MQKFFSIFVSMLFIFTIISVNVSASINEDTEIIDNKTKSTKYHIELDGYFDKAYHFIYSKNPVNDICSLIMSVIRFNDADISINDHEWSDHGSGTLFIIRYNGLYDHDSLEDTLIMDGDARFLKIFMK